VSTSQRDHTLAMWKEEELTSLPEVLMQVVVLVGRMLVSSLGVVVVAVVVGAYKGVLQLHCLLVFETVAFAAFAGLEKLFEASVASASALAVA